MAGCLTESMARITIFQRQDTKPVIVPFHGNVDMGHFAIDILVKEAKIDPKSFRR